MPCLERASLVSEPTLDHPVAHKGMLALVRGKQGREFRHEDVEISIDFDLSRCSIHYILPLEG